MGPARTAVDPHDDAPLGNHASHRQYAVSRVKDFLHHRSVSSSNSSTSEPAVWVYTGTLMDPLTGQRIANVEGLELVQLLGTTTTGSASDSSEDRGTALKRFRRRCGDLQIAKALVPEPTLSTDSNSIFCGTILSRKLFCYTEANIAHQKHSNAALTNNLTTRDHLSAVPSSRLLHQLRKRPGGPVTLIPVDQAVTVYDSAVSILVPTNAATTDGNSNNNNWLMHTEWPNGRSIWSMARLRQPGPWNGETRPTTRAAPKPTRFWLFRPRQTTTKDININNNNEAIEFAVYSRPKAPSKKLHPDDIQQLLLQPASDAEASVAPRRAAWIQLGGTTSEQQNSKYGARETYSFHPRTHTVRYSRYGEAPVWYGPGRLCQLELTGRKWDTAAGTAVPATVASVQQQYVPHFWQFGMKSIAQSGEKHRPRSIRSSKNQDATQVVANSNEPDDDVDDAVGRWMNRHFREEHPLLLIEPTSGGNNRFYPVWQTLNLIHDRGRKVMAMVRAATSISIGGG